MRYFWLIGALVFSLSFADDGLGDLVRKTEGKKGGNKPAPSRESDNSSSPSRSSDDKGNKPRPSDNSAPQGGQGGARRTTTRSARSRAAVQATRRSHSRTTQGACRWRDSAYRWRRAPCRSSRVPC
jgi:hypothetical protein